MSGFLGRARVATVVAAALALLATGVVAGAAGQAMIIGQSNDSGSAQTILLTTAGGASFTLKNTTAGQTGQFGWSSGATGAGRGVYGRADSPDGFGMDAFNNSATLGAGAALRARGNNNVGVLATSANTNAIESYSESGSGIWAQGTGFTGGVIGDGEGSLAGLIGLAPTTYAAYGVYAAASYEDGTGVYADSSLGTAVIGYGEGSFGVDTCTSYYCSGGEFSGNNGVLGETTATSGVGVGGIDTGGSGWGVFSDGDALVVGDLEVTGTCTGCASATLAVNGSKQTIQQGDAVTLLGVTTAADGTMTMVVAPAKKDDAVVGVADRSMSRSPSKVEIKQAERTIKVRGKDGKLVDKTIPAKTVTREAQLRKWLTGDTKTAPDKYLRVITSGMFAYDGAIDASVGDALAVGDKAGKLGKASEDTARGASAGTYLGKLKDGRSVLLVGAQ